MLCRSVLSNSATPRTLACQVPLSMGILQARIPEWVATSSSRLRSYSCSYCVYKNLRRSWASQVVLLVKNLPANAGDTRDIREKVWSLGREDPLVEDMATHSVFLPGESHGQRAWSAAVHRVSQNWAWLKQLSTHACRRQAGDHKLKYQYCPRLGEVTYIVEAR